jgi:outer membrane lipoprotein-sorting protein
MMRTLRFGILVLGVACLTALQPIAQQARPQNAQQVLDRMAQAMGLANAAKIRTVQMTGTISYPAQGLQGRYEALYKAPNKTLIKLNIQGLGEVQQGYDGKVGWEKNPMTGLRELQGAELAQMRQSAQMGASNDLRKTLRNPKLAGQEKVGNRNAFVITAQTTAGVPIKVYIDAQRYLPLRMDMEAATPQGKLNTTTFLEDYRRVDGIMYPFTTRQSTAGIEAVVKTERIRHNVPIDDAIFRKPKN